MPKQNSILNNTTVPAYVAGALIGNGVNVCRQFTRILGAITLDQTVGSCSVTRPRPELAPAILGRPFEPVAMFSYHSPDVEGRTLNLGEVPLLQREVNPFIDALRSGGILVTAVHNHWLFERPRLIYVHFESVSDPLVFAQAVADAFTVLVGRAEDDPE